MSKILEAVKDRGSEPSSWVGAAVLAALSAYLGPSGADAVLNVIAAILAAVSVFMPEKGGDK